MSDPIPETREALATLDQATLERLIEAVDDFEYGGYTQAERAKHLGRLISALPLTVIDARGRSLSITGEQRLGCISPPSPVQETTIDPQDGTSRGLLVVLEEMLAYHAASLDRACPHVACTCRIDAPKVDALTWAINQLRPHVCMPANSDKVVRRDYFREPCRCFPGVGGCWQRGLRPESEGPQRSVFEEQAAELADSMRRRPVVAGHAVLVWNCGRCGTQNEGAQSCECGENAPRISQAPAVAERTAD